ncbi:immunoglobulin superfamily member 6 isoform X2 [Neopelma chrysocephalum]|uniref:immunoglobulin superfamily member 6 isoform X2 n=1 Tax=Neopelma chrysocephalum TaxID=114329 RepID=UPI000FCD4CD6|nr:immunoglobulin superfamily member 6 isoform X2 [Neopelma chrysocephalum]
MAPFNNLKNVLVLAFDWILYRTGVADNCQVTVTQPRFQEADSSMSSVVLTCAFSASGCPSPLEVLWFRFLAHTHQDLCTPECKDHHKYKVQSSESNTSLEIKDLTVEDNAVYICGIAFPNSDSPRSKQTGDGTVLMKTGEQHSNGKLAFTFMIIISSLLFVYSFTVFTFFVVYKKINSGRKVFQAIAQELQKQGFAEHCHQPDDLEADTVYQNR